MTTGPKKALTVPVGVGMWRAGTPRSSPSLLGGLFDGGLLGGGDHAGRAPAGVEPVAVPGVDFAGFVVDGEAEDAEAGVDWADLFDFEQPAEGDPGPGADRVEPEVHCGHFVAPRWWWGWGSR